MPIFEYECRGCGHRFEALVGPTFPEPTCPACEGTDLEQKVSMFAVSSESTKSIALKDGRKRAESVRKEKAQAQIEYEKHHQH
jgi:putative FmdB family regulatory protein